MSRISTCRRCGGNIAEPAFEGDGAYPVGRGMAFPDTYTVHGTKRDKIKQYGNAVTPPAMQLQIGRVVESMGGERLA